MQVCLKFGKYSILFYFIYIARKSLFVVYLTMNFQYLRLCNVEWKGDKCVMTGKKIGRKWSFPN
jgi:hypothetical protein